MSPRPDLRADTGRCRWCVFHHRRAFSRSIVERRVPVHMRAETVLDALGMARWFRG